MKDVPTKFKRGESARVTKHAVMKDARFLFPLTVQEDYVGGMGGNPTITYHAITRDAKSGVGKKEDFAYIIEKS